MLSVTTPTHRHSHKRCTVCSVTMISAAIAIAVIIILQLRMRTVNDASPIEQMAIRIHDLFTEPLVIKAEKDFFFHQTHRTAINVQIQEPDPFMYPTLIPLLNKTDFDIETTIQTHGNVAAVSVDGQNQPFTAVDDGYTFRILHATTQALHATFVSFEVRLITAREEVVIDFYFYAPKQPDPNLKNWKKVNYAVLHTNPFWSNVRYDYDPDEVDRMDPYGVIGDALSTILVVERDELNVDRIIDTVRRKQTHFPFFPLNVKFGAEEAIDIGGPSQEYLEIMMKHLFTAIGSNSKQFTRSGLVFHNTSVDDMRTVIEAMGMCLYRNGMKKGSRRQYTLRCPLFVDTLRRVYFELAILNHLRDDQEREQLIKSVLYEFFDGTLRREGGWNETEIQSMDNDEFKQSYGFGVFDKVSTIMDYYRLYFAPFCDELGTMLHKLGWTFLDEGSSTNFVNSLYQIKIDRHALMKVINETSFESGWTYALDEEPNVYENLYKQHFARWMNSNQTDSEQIALLNAFWTGSRFTYPKPQAKIVLEKTIDFDEYVAFKGETCYHKMTIKTGMNNYSDFEAALVGAITDTSFNFE